MSRVGMRHKYVTRDSESGARLRLAALPKTAQNYVEFMGLSLM